MSSNLEEYKKLQVFIKKYLETGDEKFYRALLSLTLNKIVLIEKGTFKGISPEIELLNYHDKFMIWYRREGDITLLKIAKVFRRAGHKIYRLLLKKNLIQTNEKFLNLV